MKEKDFDFKQVGKRMPYRMDKDALDRVTRNVLDACEKENDSRKSNLHRLKSRKYYFYYALGAVAAVLFLFVYIGIGHQDSSDPIRTAGVQTIDSLRQFPVISERYAGDISDTTFPKDLRTGVSSPKKGVQALNSSASSLTEDKLPTDELIDELSDEDLLFLTEITGGTVADQWYN